jgi:hypothetical protein
MHHQTPSMAQPPKMPSHSHRQPPEQAAKAVRTPGIPWGLFLPQGLERRAAAKVCQQRRTTWPAAEKCSKKRALGGCLPFERPCQHPWPQPTKHYGGRSTSSPLAKSKRYSAALPGLDPTDSCPTGLALQCLA